MKISAQINGFALPTLVAILALAGCGQNHAGTDKTAAQPIKSPLQLKLQPFQPQANIGTFKGCNVEALDEARFQGRPLDANSSNDHAFAGWVADIDLTHASYWLRFENKAQGLHYQAMLTLTVKRPDVVAANHGGVPLNSGFEQQLPAQALPAGHYHAYVVAIQGDQASACDNGREVNVR